MELKRAEGRWKEGCEARMENGIEITEAVAVKERDGDRAGRRKRGGGAYFGARAARAWRTRARASASNRATKTAATVRHEREQGDEEGEREREASIVVMEKRRPERGTTRDLVLNTRAARVAHGSSSTHARRR